MRKASIILNNPKKIAMLMEADVITAAKIGALKTGIPAQEWISRAIMEKVENDAKKETPCN